MLRLTFLGTGTSQGVPMIGCDCEVCRSGDPHDKRLRSSVMVEHFAPGAAEADTRIIIDAGPDFRYQMLRENVKTADAILLTHEHKDHIAGIDDVRGFNYFRQGAFPIYASERVAAVVRKDFDYAFAEDKYPGAPDIELKIVDPGRTFEINGLAVTPILGFHHRLPVTGYRIGMLAYLTDFNHIPEPEMRKLKGVEVFVVNALRHEEHISHYNVAEATEVCRRIGAERSYFTHMSHQIGRYRDIKDTLPPGMEYAWDGLKVEI